MQGRGSSVCPAVRPVLPGYEVQLLAGDLPHLPPPPPRQLAGSQAGGGGGQSGERRGEQRGAEGRYSQALIGPAQTLLRPHWSRAA